MMEQDRQGEADDKAAIKQYRDFEFNLRELGRLALAYGVQALKQRGLLSRLCTPEEEVCYG